YGFLIVSLVQTVGGRLSIELRADVRLADQPGTARTQAQHLTVGVDLTIRAVLTDITHQTAAAHLPTRIPDQLDTWLNAITPQPPPAPAPCARRPPETSSGRRSPPGSGYVPAAPQAAPRAGPP